MRFDVDKVNGQTAGLGCYYHSDLSDVINGDVEALVTILKSYSSICGDKTKQRLRDAIDGSRFLGLGGDSAFTRDGIDYCDTPIRGRHFVYLWFDSDGELFYIGKGKERRATNMYSRSAEFREKAEGGCCKYVAYNLDEIYAFDLERILIWEALFSGKQLLNIDGGNGAEAILYCKHERDALLCYWNHEGTIDRFSELTGITVVYDARSLSLDEAIDSRRVWWEGNWVKTNDPSVLEELRKTEERRQKQREYQANRRTKKSKQSTQN